MSFRLVDLMAGLRIDVETSGRSAGSVDQEGAQERENSEEADEDGFHGSELS